MKIEVDAMTGLVESRVIEPEVATVSGWGWTHWDGPDAGGKLYIVFAYNDPKHPFSHVFVLYSNGEVLSEMPRGITPRQFALDMGWRPVMNY